jgi:hypothetical protein
MELFTKYSVPELTTKNMDNSTSFLTITRMTLFAKRFRSYGISTNNIAVEFCFWTEQWKNGSSISSLGLSKILEVPHTVSEENFLSFPMVY